MKSVYILPFLLVLTSATLGVDISLAKFPTAILFACLANKSVSSVALKIYDSQGGVQKANFLASFIAAKDVKMKVIDAIVEVNDSDDVEDLCNELASGLPGKFDGTLWLNVQKQKGQWSLPQNQRISFLEKFTKACQNHGLKPGVSSTITQWNDVMGSPTAGSDILKAVPLWYVHDDSPQNFDDFDYAAFGTWDAPALKTYKIDASNFCQFDDLNLTYSA